MIDPAENPMHISSEDLTEEQQEVAALYDDLGARFIAAGDRSGADLLSGLKKLYMTQVVGTKQLIAVTTEYRDNVENVLAGAFEQFAVNAAGMATEVFAAALAESNDSR